MQKNNKTVNSIILPSFIPFYRLYLAILLCTVYANTSYTQCTTIASDSFSSGDNSGGSGWTNNWTFSNASVVSGELFMDGNSFGTASRSLNLSSESAVSLSFTFRCDDTSSGFELADFVRVQISIDGGTTFNDYWYRNGDQICPNANDGETYHETVIIPGGSATTVIRLETSTNSGSEDVYWDNISVRKSNPVIKAFAIQVSCTNGMPNADGYLQLSEMDGGDRYHYSAGNTFDDNSGSNTYANAASLSSATYPLQVATGLANPTGSQDYTIRVYNQSNTCYTDVVVTLNEQDCRIGCACEEKVYVNDISKDIVHKFSISNTGSLVEIGTPWLATGNIDNPHGLGIDLNGRLYIGDVDGYNNSLIGSIHQLNCDGEVLENDFVSLVNNNYGYQLFSKDGILYTANNQDGEMQAFDLCDGSLIGSMDVGWTGNTGVAWGMYLDEAENSWYLPDRKSGKVYRGSLDSTLYTTPSTISGTEVFDVNVTASTAHDNGAVGITRDLVGNFYIVFNAISGAHDTTYIRKYDPLGNLLVTIQDVTSAVNDADGLAGFWGSRGIVYSEEQNLLYVGSFDNCVTVFDTNLVEQTALNIGNPAGSSIAKGMALVKECCPTNNNITIDTILCTASITDKIFLQELINCRGTICEGLWQAGVGNTGLSYNACDNSVTINSLNACGSFTLESDGLGNNPQCDAFKITVNITINALDLIVTQTSCTDNGNGTFSTNYDVVINWNSEPCQIGEMIDVTHNGISIGVIDPSTDSSPSTFPLTIAADGTGTHAIQAAFTIAGCSDSTFFKAPIPCPADVVNCSSTSTCLGGNVFEDFNCNGTADTYEPGVQGIEIQIYDCNNALVGTGYSDAEGDWQVCSLIDGAAYRVEFVLPESISCWAKPTHTNSSGNQSNIQFLTTPACTQFSISSPETYCQANPTVITPCYVPTDQSGTEDVLVGFPYISTGDTPSSINHLAVANEIGSTWGVAYNRSLKTIFAASVIKRHAGLGSGGIGAIYSVDPTETTAPVLWLDVETLSGVDVGSIGNNSTRGLTASATTATHDPIAYSKVGAEGIGGIDLSEDDSKLYVMNLFQKTLLEIDVSTKTLINQYSLPDPNCINGTNRPYAVKYYKGQVYVGQICDGSLNGTSTDMDAYIYRLDGTSFTQILNFSLDYPKEFAASNCVANTGWFPWENAGNITECLTQFGKNWVVRPTPILSDIEFDINGDMILAFMDRTGQQMGSEQYLLTGSTLYSVYGGGDILRAARNSTNAYTIETINTDADEFYQGDEFVFDNGSFAFSHLETALGALALLSGEGEVIMTAYDPLTFNSMGTYWLSNTTGAKLDSFQLVTGEGTDGAFGKAIGLGDVELLCNLAPLEIGNYVWCDSIQNGIQDACERGIDSLIVRLYDASNRLVGQDTTINGNYYFNQYNVDTMGITVDVNGVATPNTGWTGLNYNSDYHIVFGYGQYDMSSGEFTVGAATYEGFTTADTGSNDNIDSDVTGATFLAAVGSKPRLFPVIDMTTAATGCGDHKYDFGLLCTSCPTIDSLMADRVICPGDIVDTLAVVTTVTNPDSIAFVYFTTAQTDSSVIYSSGVGIDTVRVASDSDTVRIFNINGFTNTGITPDTFFVYGIAHPMSSDVACRPYEELLVIVQPDPIATVADVLKCTTNSETISVSPSGGTGPYTYTWSGPFITNPGNVSSFTATSPGMYSVTVEDADGCTTTASGEMTFQSKVCIPATFIVRRGQGN